MENVVETSQDISNLPSKAKAVVVGAGIAGLTAAAKLFHNGLDDVVLLEAQDYVGGRAKAMLVDGKLLDMGAMFIHGQEGNPLYDIVKTVSTIIDDDHEDDIFNRPKTFFTSSGTQVPFKDVEDLIDFLEDCMTISDECNQDGHISRGDLVSASYSEFLGKFDMPLDQTKKEIFDAAYQWFCFYEKLNEGADDLNDVSTWAVELYHTFKGNFFTRFVGGYPVVVETFTNLLPKGVIHTKTPVTRIEWGRSGEGKVMVECGNGNVIAADHVIITMSIGCLKAIHHSMFDPALPSPFLNAIGGIELGAAGKIMLQWETPFWNTCDCSYEFLWLESSPISLKSDKSKRQTKMKRLWWEDIAGLETVSSHANILLIWVLSHQVEVLKDIGDEEVKAVLHELIQVFLSDVEVPEPIAIYRTNWRENPYVRGCFSYPTPSLNRSDVKHLGQAIPSIENPQLLFAGEAYGLEYMTTTHGGFITAEQQAEKVLKANGISQTISVVDVVTAKHK